MLVLLRMSAFIVFALCVGLVGRVTRRVRARRARRWRLSSSSHTAVMVGHCTTMREVHDTFGAVDTPCPFCTTVQRPAFRRTQVGPLVIDWYASPPATEALPDDVDERTSRPILVDTWVLGCTCETPKRPDVDDAWAKGDTFTCTSCGKPGRVP